MCLLYDIGTSNVLHRQKHGYLFYLRCACLCVHSKFHTFIHNIEWPYHSLQTPHEQINDHHFVMCLFCIFSNSHPRKKRGIWTCRIFNLKKKDSLSLNRANQFQGQNDVHLLKLYIEYDAQWNNHGVFFTYVIWINKRMFVPRFSQNIFYTLGTHAFRICET